MIVLALPVLLAVVVGVIVWAAGRSHDGAEQAEGTGFSLRRLLQYAGLLTAAFVVAGGLATLAAYALPESARLAGKGQADLALGLSLVLVGVPSWVVLWRVVRRRLASDPVERSSTGWVLYLAAAVTVALVVALVNLVDTGAWLLDAADYEPSAVATGLVWAVVWAAHALLSRQPAYAPAGRLAGLVSLAGSAVALVAVAIGAGEVLAGAFEQVYRAVAPGPLADAATSTSIRRGATLGLLAAGAWAWHWLGGASRGPYDRLWNTYVLLVPVLGGTLTATVAAAIALHAALRWLFGGPGLPSAPVHFAVLPGALAALLVGVWAWWYHYWVRRERQPAGRTEEERTEAERTYAYLVAGVGLIAATGGAVAAIIGLLEAVAPAPLAVEGSGNRDTLAVAVTLLAVGTPAWWVFWRPSQARAHAGTGAVEHGEVASPSRRAYLFLLFGANALAALVSLSVVLYVFLRELLEERLDGTVLHDLRVALAFVAATGGVAAYHWVVFREDRQAEPPRARPKTLLLVSGDGRAAVRELEARTGARVRALQRADAGPPAERRDWSEVVAAVEASPHERLLVLAEPDGTTRVIPYEAD